MIVSVLKEELKFAFVSNLKVFDNGDLRADIEKGQQFLDTLLSIMRDCHVDNTQKPVLVAIHDTVWHRVVKVR